jgi:hypothetical protein
MAPQTIEIAKNGLESAGLRWLVRRIPQERAGSTEGERRRGGSGREIWNAADPAETQRLERGHQRAGSEYNLEGQLRRGKIIFI